VLAFTGFYYVATSAVGLVRGNRELGVYLVLMAVLIGVAWVVHRRCRLRPALLWCLSVWGGLHMVGGLVPIPDGWPHNGPGELFYSMWLVPGCLRYDQLVHAYGFGVTTWLCWEVLRHGIERRHGVRLAPSPGAMVLCVAAGMGFGALNEVVEFFATLALPRTNVGGYVNTGWDLVFNALGASTAGVVIALDGRRASGLRESS